MKNFDCLHEVEDVVLLSETKRPCRPLWNFLKIQGFTLYEDLFSLDRPKKPNFPIWQSEAFVDVDIFNENLSVYGLEEKWDKIVLKYLLATQPRSGIAVFSKQAFEISTHLEIQMTFRGKCVSYEELENSLNCIADEFEHHIGIPGSEDVAIVIQSTYPRRGNQ